jgi:hypothetical protein
MFELVVNVPFSMLIAGQTSTVPTDAAIYVDGSLTTTPVVTAVPGTDNRWKLTFTPTSSGTHSVYAFGIVQATFKAVNKSLYDYLLNLEDDALGSWTWNKSTGLMTVLRQNGNQLCTFDVKDSLTEASKERL